VSSRIVRRSFSGVFSCAFYRKKCASTSACPLGRAKSGGGQEKEASTLQCQRCYRDRMLKSIDGSFWQVTYESVAGAGHLTCCAQSRVFCRWEISVFSHFPPFQRAPRACGRFTHAESLLQDPREKPANDLLPGGSTETRWISSVRGLGPVDTSLKCSQFVR